MQIWSGNLVFSLNEDLMSQITLLLCTLSLLLSACSVPNKSHSEINLLRINETQIAALPKEKQTILQHVNEDIRLIVLGKNPKHATPKAVAADGGTAWFTGEGYDIYSWNSLSEVLGVTGFIRGVSVSFNPGSECTQSPAYTWFEPVSSKNPR
jgi:hypothetical protein